MNNELYLHPFIFASNLEKSVIRYLIAGSIFLFANLSFAQTIQVLNEQNGEAIAGAIIYSEHQSSFVETNPKGMADLDVFLPNEKLIIQHPSFHIYTFFKRSLNAGSNQIFLKEKVIRIDEVVISANKWEQKKSEIPFEIMSLGAEEVGFMNAQTAADALEASGQVFVQKSQLGGGSPMIRGFGANAVLIVVDGVRMNNAIFRGGNLQNIINIDPGALESSEVIFGPGAVIYGSDALGGVMDFHTIKPTYSADGALKTGGYGLLRYSSANQEKTGTFQLRAAKDKWAYAGNFTLSDFGDLRAGSVRPKDHPDFGKRPEYVSTIGGVDSIVKNTNENLQRFSGYTQINTLQKFSLRINSRSELINTFNFSTTNDIPRYDRLTLYQDADQLEYAQWYYGPQKWMMNALKFNFFQPTRLFDAMKITLAYQHFEESRHDRRYRTANLRNRMERVGVISLNADFEKDLNSRNHFYYGGEFLHNRVNSSAFSKNVNTGEIGDLSTRYPDGGSEVDGLAVYLSYKRDIEDNLHLSAGLRYSYQDLNATFIDAPFDYSSIQNRNAAINGNLGLVFRPTTDWIISGMVSSGFRVPNVDDISKVFDSEPGNVVVPNPDLKPEYSYNGELSFTKIFVEKIELNGTVFYAYLEDAMVRGDFEVNGQDSIMYDGALSRVQAIVNTGKAHIYGFNVGLNIDFDANWSARANLNVTEGSDLVADEPLRHTTPVFGMASLQYTRKMLKGEFFARFNGKRSLEDLPPSERNKPNIYSSEGALGWFTLNLSAQYQLKEWLSINAALENILDHHYRTYSSGISAPGRNVILSLKASF
jgi:hemoglobin/transferrin/lactoferrin receptor protein